MFLPHPLRSLLQAATLSAFATASLIGAPSPASAQNPPTNYSGASTPYDGTETWYCERVSGTLNRSCTFAGIGTSITNLSNLVTAPSLTTTGVVTTGGASGAGYQLSLGTISYAATHSLPDNQLSANFAIPIPLASGGTGSTAPTQAASNGVQTTGVFPNQQFSAKAGASLSQGLGNPGGTTSLTGVMMGLGVAGCAITPNRTGVVMMGIQGSLINTGASNSWGDSVSLRYGTGSAPANGAAAVGTALTSTIYFANLASNSGTGSQTVPFHVTGVVGGLTLATTYWFDLLLAAVIGGNAGVVNDNCYAVEF